jgi:hypothetical protein
MVVLNGTVVPWSLQLCKFGACVRSSSVRRNHSRCDDLHSNPPCPLGTTKLPMPPAMSTGHTVRFDSHMRTNSQGVTMAQVAQRGNSWRVVRRGKPRVKHSATERAACTCAPIRVGMSIHLCTLRAVRAAPVAAMARELKTLKS